MYGASWAIVVEAGKNLEAHCVADLCLMTTDRMIPSCIVLKQWSLFEVIYSMQSSKAAERAGVVPLQFRILIMSMFQSAFEVDLRFDVQTQHFEHHTNITTEHQPPLQLL